MAGVDIFLQRDAAGVADVSFVGDGARLLKDGAIVRDWTAGGVLEDVAAGDGYTLEVRHGETVTQQSLAIGVVVVAAGQSNMAGWMRSYRPVPSAEHTYMLGDTAGWGAVTGNGAKVYTAVLAEALGVPVGIVDASVSGSPLLEKNRNPAGYWLDPDGIYAGFQALMAGIGGRAEIVLWAQGEQDGYPRTTQEEYAAGLETLVRWFQRDLSPTAIELIELGRIENEIGGGLAPDQVRFPLVRAAQHQVAESVPGVFVGAGSLGVDGSVGLDQADKLHRNTVSYAFEAFQAASSLLARYGVANPYAQLSGSAGGETLTGGGGATHVLGREGDDTIVTGAAGDVIDGGLGNDVIDAGDGDNLVRGDDGDDVIRAGGGSDLISGGLGRDTIFGGAGKDDLWGDAGDDRLFGGDDADLLNGGLGNDFLDGGAGNDRMTGGAGDDTYVFLDVNDLIIEEVGGGDDTIQGMISIDLREFANVENVTLVAGNNATGSDEANRLVGSDYANTLTGLGGDDLLDGRGGADSLIGGSGDDTYVVDDAFDRVVEAAGDGHDIVYASVSYVTPDHVEELVLTGTHALDARGTAAAETIVGNIAANRIDGGGGADRLYGGDGDDTYVVRDAATLVYELPGGGIDTVETSVDYTIADDVENLRAIGPHGLALTGNALGNRIRGAAGADVIDGDAGDDVIEGGAGDDLLLGGDGTDVAVFAGALVQSVVTRRADGSYLLVGPDGSDVLDGVEYVRFAEGVDHRLADLLAAATVPSDGDDVLTGTDAADTIDALGGNDRIAGLGGNDRLVGGAGGDWLDGGAGNDLLTGGAGDDFYVVDAAGDLVVEQPGDGTDTVYSSVTRTLEANVENLVLTGSVAINGTGNAGDNLLRGNAAANTLTGGDGADVLDGGAGADTMAGGFGDDHYWVDDAGDRVVEYGGTGPAQTGYDTVHTTISYALPVSVENIVLEGIADIDATGNGQANMLTGNAGDNVLDGGVGADTMAGGAGDDTYVVDSRSDVVIERAGEGVDTVRTALGAYTLGAEVENLVYTGTTAGILQGNELHNRLVGGAGNDTLRAYGGNDVLDGGAGADSMAGGDGDDTYWVDDAGDLVLEYAGGGAAVTGYDTVHAAISYTLASSVEALVLEGDGDLSATGNNLANFIQGNAGDNLIDGGTGFDTMAGGAGDDTYVVRESGDRVVERAGEGVDTVLASVSVQLSDHVENLVLTGTAAVNGTGNALANRITGNTAANLLSGGDGDDVIEGGGGADVLTGGAGADTFVLRAGQAAGARIADFTAGEDRIALVGFGQGAEVIVTGDTLVVRDGVRVESVAVAGAADVTLVAPDFGAGNVAPTILPPGDLAASQGAPFSFTLPAGSVADANAGDWLYLSAMLADGTPLPAWLAFDARTATFSGTPGAQDTGALALRITVTDAGGASAHADTVLTIAANHAPAVTGALLPLEATTDATFSYTLPALFADADAGDTLALSLASADGAPLPAWLAFDPATGTLSGMPQGEAGTLALVLTATDRAGAQAALPFDLVVAAANHAPVPVAEAPAPEAAVAQPFAFSAADLFADTDAGDTLSFSLAGTDGAALPAWLTFDAATGTLSGTPGYGDVGAIALTLTAIDRAGASATIAFALTVADHNNAPVLTATLPPQTALATEAFAFALPAGLFHDDAGDALTLSATLADGGALPAWLTFDAASGTFSGTPARGDIAALDLAITATDHAGAHATAAFSLAVAAQPGRLVVGGPKADLLMGATGNDILRGYAGADVLDGGEGADQMIGGDGNDTYHVDHVGDQVVEYIGTGPAVTGFDTVHATIDHVLASGVERLILDGHADLSGTGNALANTLIGNDGANWLDGLAGSDTMSGGRGDDTYVVGNSGDRVVELAGEGYDTVRTTLTSYILPVEVERLVFVGTGAATLRGNALDNVVVGGAGADTLGGGDGNDRLEGGAGADALAGGAGADWLDGGAGADTMTGGDGDDVYVVDHAGDRVLEYNGAGAAVSGIDAVLASVSFTLGSWVERLTLTGTDAIDGTGNTLDNQLFGNAAANRLSGGRGDDVIEGGGGADVLSGGAGADTFVLRAGQTEGLRITDFAAGEDVMRLYGFGSDASAELAGGWLTITDGAAVTRVQVDGTAVLHAAVVDDYLLL
jgi:Ca2+-binding RTX toxin-like protein